MNAATYRMIAERREANRKAMTEFEITIRPDGQPKHLVHRFTCSFDGNHYRAGAMRADSREALEARLRKHVARLYA